MTKVRPSFEDIITKLLREMYVTPSSPVDVKYEQHYMRAIFEAHEDDLNQKIVTVLEELRENTRQIFDTRSPHINAQYIGEQVVAATSQSLETAINRYKGSK